MKVTMQLQSVALMSANEIISNISQHKNAHNILFCTFLFSFIFWLGYWTCASEPALSAQVARSAQHLHQQLIKNLSHLEE